MTMTMTSSNIVIVMFIICSTLACLKGMPWTDTSTYSSQASPTWQVAKLSALGFGFSGLGLSNPGFQAGVWGFELKLYGFGFRG